MLLRLVHEAHSLDAVAIEVTNERRVVNLPRDIVRPRMCNYTILSDEQARRRWGTHNLRSWLKVTKTRELWMHENVRIHLDDVDRLGVFLEFEAVVSRACDVQTCHQKIRHLRQVFGPTLGEPVAPSYCDLMAAELAEKK